MANFTFQEFFSCACENSLPRSISIEKNSAYTHNHIRWEDEICYVCCEGNKLFEITPALVDSDVSFRFRFHNTYGHHGCALYFRYDRMLRQGLSIELIEEKEGCYLYLCLIDREEREIVDRIHLEIDALPEENLLKVCLN